MHVNLKLYLHSQNLYMQYFIIFHANVKQHNLKQAKTLYRFFSFNVRSYSFDSRQVDRYRLHSLF